jgi:hypothetical protein
MILDANSIGRYAAAGAFYPQGKFASRLAYVISSAGHRREKSRSNQRLEA